MATIKKAQNGAKKKPSPSLLKTPKFGEVKPVLGKLPEPTYSGLNLLSRATKKDSTNYKKGFDEGRSTGKSNLNSAKTYEEYAGNFEGRSKGPVKKSEIKYKSGGAVKKKMKNGGSLSGLKASNKRVGPVDPKGAFTKVQKKTLAGAKGKASLTKDKQLGATKMAKSGAKMSKGKKC